MPLLLQMRLFKIDNVDQHSRHGDFATHSRAVCEEPHIIAEDIDIVIIQDAGSGNSRFILDKHNGIVIIIDSNTQLRGTARFHYLNDFSIQCDFRFDYRQFLINIGRNYWQNQ